ncbi:Fur family transcriptional regulator [Dysosmobacter sp.]|jgi:Fur family ferric uptake transcriptional regulator|uniref:Fur family transcriptional regulator n=1 Tax=Dysosmobacter sp. TaxID=2591382 RepID=UPI002D7E37DE|nr:transcriptional repressor [uncultured Oscillibacter sp.]
MPYSTKQQQAVLRCLESRESEALSAQELAEELRREGFSVGLATIYRQLERLEEAGVVHKVNTESGAFYLYCSHGEGRRDCFLLKCQRCGRIRHLDCDHLKDLYEHLETAHHFRIDPRRTLFTGLCEECAREEDTHGNQ